MTSEKTTAAVGHNALSAGLALLDEIPPLDISVHRLIEALADEDISETKLAAIINKCPSLSGRIVGLANSAYFRRNKVIDNLQDAIFLVGMRTVKSFAIAAALQEPFSNSQCPAFRPGRFWLNDVLTAHVARDLCKQAAPKHGLNPEQAYLAGLLHNIGLLALAHLFPEQLNQILQDNEQHSNMLSVRTQAAFGLDYLSVGAALLKHWHLPEPFVTVVRHNASPDYQGAHWELCRIVGVARDWAAEIVHQETTASIRHERLTALGISAADAEAVRVECLAHLDSYVQLTEIISGTRAEFQRSGAMVQANIDLKERLVDTIGSLSSIRALTDLNIRNKTENEILGGALKILMEHQEMQRCSIFLNEGSLVVNASGLSWEEHFSDDGAQAKTKISSHTFSLGEGIVGMVAESGELQHVNNCSEDPLFKALDTQVDYVPGSLICVPVRFQDSILGVLNISHSKPGVFDEWHERFLTVFANMLGQLIVYNRIIRDMDAQINQRTNELQMALARAESLSTHDDLTGLHNRRYFISHFGKLIQQCARYDCKLAVLMIDIDDFKVINDSYGHLEGDRTLIKVAEALSHCARDADIVARLGGEEFIIALQHADCDMAQQVANRVLEKIRQLDCGDEIKYRITTSIGISCYAATATMPKKTTEVWLQEADKALYVAKHSGKDRIGITRHE
ncbi:MAG: diguanylate cyclase [Gammaproteobacteria bacterium]